MLLNGVFIQRKPGPLTGRKRVCDEQRSSPKRKHSPIRFEASLKDTPKKVATTIYSPPKDKFSKKFAEGSKFVEYPSDRRGSRRGGRGKRGSRPSWRQ